MAIPYRTAKFKSANTFAMAIWEPTAKFNSHQYFRLYSINTLLAALYTTNTSADERPREMVTFCQEVGVAPGPSREGQR